MTVCSLNRRTLRTFVSLWLSYVYLVAGRTEVNTESYSLRLGKESFDGIPFSTKQATMKRFLTRYFWNIQRQHTKALLQGNHVLDKLGFPIPPNCQFKFQSKKDLPANWHIFQKQSWQRYVALGVHIRRLCVGKFSYFQSLSCIFLIVLFLVYKSCKVAMMVPFECDCLQNWGIFG